MKNIYKLILSSFLLCVFSAPAYAGNKDRTGQAGAAELLINPWARSAGWASACIANGVGLESVFTNVAGMAFTKRTEVGFSNTQYFSSTAINSFGIAQRINESTVLGASVMATGFGDMLVTTENNPDGSSETFSVSFVNINLSYARAFSNSIYAGFNLKVISESSSSIAAKGVAIDAGIQYVTGEKEQIKFGLSLKNIGPPLKFGGDALNSKIPNTNQTVSKVSAGFELPTQLNIGLSYDLDINQENKLTFAGAFTSNAFANDMYTIGVEYGLLDYLKLRTAYSYEKGLFGDGLRPSFFTGFNGGLSVQVPLQKEKGTIFAIDYAYRSTSPLKGTHQIGVRLNF